jgi:energy-coupling factor transport system permease protein
MYLALGAVVVLVRVVLHVAVGFGYGEHVLLRLPAVPLPAWAAGIQLGGPVHLESLLDATFQGLRLATLIICLGAANSLANPKRLLRSVPGALHEIGVAVVVSVTVLPQLAQSVHRVRRARRLRGDATRGVRAVPRVALPVLQDALERSLLLAAAMDARGYGRRTPVAPAARRTTSALLLCSLVVLCLGVYQLLTTDGAPMAALVLLSLGAALAAGGFALGGRQATRSRYRPDRWGRAEWLTAATGVASATGLLVAGRVDPGALMVTMQPLALPVLPPVAAVGVLVGALAVVTSPPARTETRPPAGASRDRRLTGGSGTAAPPATAPSVPARRRTTEGAVR